MIRSILLLIMALCAAPLTWADCCVPLAMQVSSARSNEGRPTLKVIIENRGTSTISIGPAQNPWVGPAMIKVVAMRLPSGVIVQNRSRAVIDPRLDSEDLRSGEKLEDVVYLDQMYPEVAAEIRRAKEDIILFWTYQFSGSEVKSERFGGWVLFKPSPR